MASLREIRRKIKSVKSTQQITKAMKMMAVACILSRNAFCSPAHFPEYHDLHWCNQRGYIAFVVAKTLSPKGEVAWRQAQELRIVHFGPMVKTPVQSFVTLSENSNTHFYGEANEMICQPQEIVLKQLETFSESVKTHKHERMVVKKINIVGEPLVVNSSQSSIKFDPQIRTPTLMRNIYGQVQEAPVDLSPTGYRLIFQHSEWKGCSSMDMTVLLRAPENLAQADFTLLQTSEATECGE